MDLIKFTGKNKRDSVKKAVAFFYDNLDEEESLELFLARCRVQNNGKIIHFYPNLTVDIEKFRKIKSERKTK